MPRPNVRTNQIDTIRHKDKRANIPTEELRGFVAEEEERPKVMLYPRDPSLDPQLVWKGKDEQDSKDLEVPLVPVYIQEKIHPQALIEDFMRTAKEGQPAQADLFADFNGIRFEEMVDFYHHEQNWSNRMILGDSLLVMTSLAEKEGLKGKVQMIYIDPPYGINFGSNWQVSTRKRDVKDGRAEDATRQPEQIRAFRDTWKLGIHSYLAYLRDRLVTARELLTESGSVFVQIGDANLHLVRCLLDEVLGPDNFVSLVTFKKTSGATGEYLPGTNDYVVWYAKNIEHLKFRQTFREREVGGVGGEAYTEVEEDDGFRRRMSADETEDLSRLKPGSRVFRLQIVTSQRQGRPAGPGSAMYFPVRFKGRDYFPQGQRGWTTTEEGMNRLVRSDRIETSGESINYVRYHSDFPGFPLTNLWDDTQSGSGMDKIYVVQTNTKVIERCLAMTTDAGDLVLDPTCGSGTTAYVAEQWGRRWITIDTSRVALALARTRLMTARYPYYVLADSPEGLRKEAEVTGTVPTTPAPSSTEEGSRVAGDIKKGFVYKRVPHITLKSIANNEETDAIYAKWQERLEPARTDLNKALKKSWEEWEVPREAEAVWPEKAKKLHAEWWKLRRDRQKEIDESIARHAETELLYDQPYEDSKRVRVAGPFTVESLSPHRALTTDEDRPATEAEARREPTAGQFEAMILENLKKAGVQNTIKNERLIFDRLEPYPGTWLHAAGEYTEKGGKARRVAVSIGPEHGTVGREQVKEAAKEAVQGIGFDTLIVCGFYFDSLVSEETKLYGKLTVLTARMNYDLAMGDELLKKTGAGNLFVLYGEPDIDVKKEKDGRLTVKINGVDVYDPTTGQVRSHSTDDIAAWFIDTAYNGESFFVRHAYFTGAGDPYEKLKRALRAEIDEAAWSALYSTISRPFDPPKTGKIAVKVINHYGDEVLKVYATA
jgi:adenine-specific DNA-methyltransferase